MILNSLQVKDILYNAGFRNAALNAAVQIAFCESSFNTLAHNTAGEDSRGLMQINVAPGANPQYANLNLFDAQTNANVAFEIYKERGYNFSAWTCARLLNLVNPPPGIDNNLIAVFLFASIGLLLYINQ